MKAIGSRSISSLLNVGVAVSMYAVGLILALMACIVILSFVAPDLQNFEMDVPVSVRLESGTIAASAPSFGIDEAEVQDVRGVAMMKFRPPNRMWAALTATGAIAALGVLLWILVQLRGVFRTLAAGHPFVAANAARIRRIGYAIILGELGVYALGLIATDRVWSHFTAEGLVFDARPDLNVAGIVSGVIILVIAEVFRAGTRLDEEQSLTV
jgi:hypothetical protein